jgi:hypothetical protein
MLPRQPPAHSLAPPEGRIEVLRSDYANATAMIVRASSAFDDIIAHRVHHQLRPDTQSR